MILSQNLHRQPRAWVSVSLEVLQPGSSRHHALAPSYSDAPIDPWDNATEEAQDHRARIPCLSEMLSVWLGSASGRGSVLLHDLRHETVSRFFESGLTVPEVTLISGHRNPSMLSRNTYLRPEKLAEKLAKVAT